MILLPLEMRGLPTSTTGYPTAAQGQEDQFPPPRLSACYVIREKTFAGTHGNGRDATKAAIRAMAIKRVATLNSHSAAPRFDRLDRDGSSIGGA